MFINDETLSAFLDNELDSAEAEVVREQLEHDEKLAERLAALAMTDLHVRERVDALNTQPIPERIYKLLEETNEPTNVVSLSRWNVLKNAVQEHVAVAASVALMIGFGLGVWTLTPTTGTPDTAIAAALETQPSGKPYALATDTTFTGQLTFVDNQGDYCRQYEVTQQTTKTTGIQCRRNGTWQQIASLEVATDTQSGGYQTATNKHMLDPVLDQIMRSAPLTPAQEQETLNAAWNSNLKNDPQH
ncbi:hypothetical protein SAMN04488070_1666 [Pseudidiomarina maritima]|uniref:Uncharacterized protein n=1 Tax=Pseudidiomarina maritima TaxID=519453 RepID=A0A1I6HAC4_9GAMM|nr:hypothetical protein [Pseudidiomarina maritima]SFR51412.1 hypothetical protein SAMN04488070_1666 [Pseudidiomarina maritima]